MDLEAEGVDNKSKRLVLLLVIGGMIVLAIGAVVAFQKRGGGGSAGADDESVARWCSLRREWATQVNTLSADIALKSVSPGDSPEDKAERDSLEQQRTELTHRYAKGLQALGISDPRLITVEQILIKEGKARANLAVKIANALTVLPAGDLDNSAYENEPILDRLELLRRADAAVNEDLKREIDQKRAAFDQEVAQALSAVPSCPAGIYRGPMTDMGAADSPYVSWDELELRRQQASRQFKPRILTLQPAADYANNLYHELVRRYGSAIKGCYDRSKRQNPDLSDVMKLRIRLKRTGEVQSLAIESMEVSDDRILECLLGRASQWRLPGPRKEGHKEILTITFSEL